MATGTTNWTTGAIDLSPGQNVLTVTARDAANNTSSARLTVTFSATSLAFTDDPLKAQITIVKAVHVTELRAAIDNARVSRGLLRFGWTDATITAGVTVVKTLHMLELRAALDELYHAASRTPPVYSDSRFEAGATSIKASHLDEVRAALKAF
jgi:hypothetical protein